MKNLKLSVLILGLFITYNCYAQTGWFWQNPLPTGSPLRDIEFLDSNGKAILVGFGETVFETTDFGDTFVNKSKFGISNYNSVYFINDHTGFICGMYGKILKTTNAADDWLTLNTNTQMHLNSIHFININTGFAVGNSGVVLKTTNSGQDWSSTILSQSSNNQICFINYTTGYIVCSNETYPNNYSYKMYKTTNSGNNWSVNFSGYGFLNSSLFFVNEYVGYSIGYSNTTGNSQVIRTTDAGLNWFAQSLTYRLMNVYFININTGFLIGDRILKTVNGGNNWYTVYDSSFYHTVENNNMLYSIDFNGYSEGIAVGSTSVLKTTNFGENWVRMSKTKTDNVICELMILDSNRVFAVGENGMILFTQNQGTDWNKINSGTIKQLNSICNVGDNKLFCVGDEGAIIYSTNNGLNWTDKSFSSIENIKDIAFLNITTGYLASSINISSQSGIYKTTNGGINWVLKTSNNNFNALQVIDSMKCYGVCRSTSHFIKTTNGGVNWIFKSMTNTGWMESIYFLNENTGFIGGFYGHIYKTSDSGNNWVLQNLWSTDEDINDICFVNENIGYAVSEWGKFLWTTNSGNNWTLNRFSNDYQYLTFCTVDFLNQNTGYIAGYDGNIMKTTTSGLFLTGTSNSSVDISNYYSLSQNYPNPFNPQTKIKFDVPANVRGQTSNVKLIVYDLLGREVATLVNEELKPGTYEADWDGSNFSSGVYFYKIISGDFVETKKMVLMK